MISSSRAAPVGVAGEHGAELGHVARARARPASTAWASSPLWLACSQSSQKMRVADELGDGDLRLAGPVGAHQADVLAGPQRALGEQHLVARRHRHDEVGGERLLARAGDVGAELVGRRLAPARRRRPRARRAGRARGTSAPPRARSRPRRSPRPPPRPARPSVSAASTAAAPVRSAVTAPASSTATSRPSVGVREQHEPRHRRQAARRVARERRHPLEQRVPAAERRHRPEVAGRVGRHVDLRRHRPLAARVGDERVAHRLDRPLRRDGRLDVPRPVKNGTTSERLDGARRASRPTPSRRRTASPSSGRRRAGCRSRRSRGSSMRFSTTTFCAWSTLRIGMP